MEDDMEVSNMMLLTMIIFPNNVLTVVADITQDIIQSLRSLIIMMMKRGNNLKKITMIIKNLLLWKNQNMWSHIITMGKMMNQVSMVNMSLSMGTRIKNTVLMRTLTWSSTRNHKASDMLLRHIAIIVRAMTTMTTTSTSTV